jgi:hypothetical protein
MEKERERRNQKSEWKEKNILIDNSVGLSM